jgi:hypothetical protein
MVNTLLAGGGPPSANAGWPDLLLVLVVAALIFGRLSVAVFRRRRFTRHANRY